VQKLGALKGPTVELVNSVDDTPSPPIDFTFISKLLLGEGVPALDAEFAFGCDCPQQACDPRSCKCLDDLYVESKQKRRFAYNKHGRVEKDNRMAIFECNSTCSCGPECENKVVQKGRRVKLQIFKTAKKGWGELYSVVFLSLNLFDHFADHHHHK